MVVAVEHRWYVEHAGCLFWLVTESLCDDAWMVDRSCCLSLKMCTTIRFIMWLNNSGVRYSGMLEGVVVVV